MNELKQAVVKELREHGITSRQVTVSVRTRDYDDVIKVTIRDPEIPEKAINTILQRFKSVQYDHSGSGEILSGGNTYVRVNKPQMELTIPDDFQKLMNKEEDFTYEGCQVIFDQIDGNVNIYDEGEIIRMVPMGFAGVVGKAWYAIHEILLERRFWDSQNKED